MQGDKNTDLSPREEAGDLEPLFAALRADLPSVPLARLRKSLSAELDRLAPDANAAARPGPSRWLRVASLLFVLLAIGALITMSRGGPAPVYGLVQAIDGDCVQQFGQDWRPTLRPVLRPGTVLRAGPGGCCLQLGCGGRIEAAPGSVLRFRACAQTQRVLLDAPARGVQLRAGKAPLPFAVGSSVFECRGCCEVKSCCKSPSRFEVKVFDGCCRQMGAKASETSERFFVDCQGRSCGCRNK